MFVIIRTADGQYVTPPGTASSYTNRLQWARIYRTREDAERERCPRNETIVSLESQLQR